MKTITLFLIFTATLNIDVLSQEIYVPNKYAKKFTTSATKTSPEYYLNNSKIDWDKTFINPENIDSIDIKKDTENGEVYIFTKNQNITLITLEELLKQRTQLEGIDNSLLFKINGNYVTEIDGLTIDESYFIYLNIIDLTQIQYLSSPLNELRIVEIDLEANERTPEIRIRG